MTSKKDGTTPPRTIQEDHAERHKIERFAGVGFKGVPDHVRIDENAQLEHEIVCGTGDEQKNDQNRFDEIGRQ